MNLKVSKDLVERMEAGSNKYFGYLYVVRILNNCSKLHNCFYIGQKKGPFNPEYFGSGTKIKNYAQKYLHKDFSRGVYIEEKEAASIGIEREIIGFYSSKQELDFMEYQIIKNYLGRKECLNLRNGGGMPGISEELKQKISESTKKSWTKELRERHSKIYKGIKKSSEVRKHMSEGTKLSYTKGRKQKLSNSLKGHKVSEETRRKISEANKGRHWFTNGKENVSRKECSEGFYPGFTKIIN